MNTPLKVGVIGGVAILIVVAFAHVSVRTRIVHAGAPEASPTTRPAGSILSGNCSAGMSLGAPPVLSFSAVIFLGGNPNPDFQECQGSYSLPLSSPLFNGVSMPSTGHLQNLTVRFNESNTLAQDAQFAVVVNGTQTTLSCTIHGTQSRCSDVVHTVAVTQFDDVQAGLIIQPGQTWNIIGGVFVSLEKR